MALAPTLAMPRRPVVPSPAAPPVSNTRLAILAVIAGESMLFAGLIGSYLVFRLAAPAWPPPNLPHLPVGLTALNTVVLFAVTTLVVVSMSLGPVGVGSPERTAYLPVLLWVILLFAASAGLPRTFVHEEETHTATALRLAATPSALFCGKLAHGLVLLLALEALVTPLFLAMMQLAVRRPLDLVVALLVGGYGLAAGSTLVAAIATFEIATWLPGVLIWMAKPWLDRTILFVLGRAAFSQDTRPADIWHARRTVWLRHAWFTWTVRRFSLWRSLTEPARWRKTTVR